MTQNCPNLRMSIWFHIFCQIFAKLFTKKREGGSDKFEIYCIEQLGKASMRLGHAKKKRSKKLLV